MAPEDPNRDVVPPLPAQPPAPPMEPSEPIASTVEKDRAADAAGEPRDNSPAKPPPGTVQTTIWQSPGMITAIAAWIVLILYVVRPYLVARWGEGGAALFEVAVWSTSGAFGIHKAGTDASTLRWK